MEEATQDKALDKLTSLEQLDRSLVVVGIKGWLLLFFFLLLVVLLGCWSIWGTIPISVTGRGLVVDLENTYEIKGPQEGTVAEIRFLGGQKVKQGEPIVVFENPHSEVVAPKDGEVLFVNAKIGNSANPNGVLLGFQGDGTIDQLRIIAFLPLFSGQEVQVGMQGYASIEKATAARYGMLKAKVVEVVPFPVSPSQEIVQLIPSEELVQYLIGHDSVPKLLVILKPEISQKNQLEWTSKTVESNLTLPWSVGQVQITLERVRPISYVLPKR